MVNLIGSLPSSFFGSVNGNCDWFISFCYLINL